MIYCDDLLCLCKTDSVLGSNNCKHGFHTQGIAYNISKYLDTLLLLLIIIIAYYCFLTVIAVIFAVVGILWTPRIGVSPCPGPSEMQTSEAALAIPLWSAQCSALRWDLSGLIFVFPLLPVRPLC